MVIATQTFGLASELTADLTGTIQALHDAGFQAIEPMVLFQDKQGRKPKNLWTYDTLQTAWDKMQTLGMGMPSVHIGVGFGWLSMPVSLIVKNILSIHERYGVSDYVVSGPFGTAALAKHWAKLTRTISDAVAPRGCRILYHNHDDEFREVHHQGKIVNAMDVFLENTSPAVLLQLDIGWAGTAGRETALAQRYAGRIASIHLKDFYPPYTQEGYTRKNMPVEAFAPIGEGCIATGEILSACKGFPNFTGNLIIDQDKSSTDMLQALKRGRSNISAMLAGKETGWKTGD